MGIAARLVRAEVESIGFRWRPTLIAAVFTFVLLAPIYWRGDWYYELLRRLGGNTFVYSARDYGFTFKMALRVALPIALILIMMERLRDFGLGLGNIKAGLRICGIFYLLYTPCFIALMLNDSFREFYAGSVSRYRDWGAFFDGQVIPFIVVMSTGEFLYRGFILFGIKKDYGPYPAILISLIPYVYLHWEKAPIEAFGSFPVGLALSYLALRTNSIWYGVILHTTIALGFNAAIFALG